MASTYSTNLKIELIGTGEQSGTWGTTTNTNLGSLIEEAIAGYVTQAVTDGAATVLTIPNGASSNGRNYVIQLTGALTANRTVEVPAVDKPYIFFNATTGGFSVTVKVSGQTGVTIANGKKAIVYTNSTDVIEVANAPVTEAGTQTLTNKTLTNPTINGFTGDTSVVNIGSGQFYKDTSGNVGIGTSSPNYQLQLYKAGASANYLQVTSGATGAASGNGTLFGVDASGNGIVTVQGAVNYITSVAGAERMRIDSSGNVGIGTASPSFALDVATPTARVRVAPSTTTNYALFQATNAGNTAYIGLDNSTGGLTAAYALNLYHNGAYPITMSTSGLERMRIDSSGNVGIGTSSIENFGSTSRLLKVAATASAGYGSLLLNSGSKTIQILCNSDSNVMSIGSRSNDYVGFCTNDTERARIDTSGTFFVGQTTNPATASMVLKVPTSVGNGINAQITSNTGTSYPFSNYNASGTYVGGISCTSSATAFPTSSDYRLKQNVNPMTGALDRISALKPVTYQWKIDETDGEGFIAHELQEVIPQSVFGEKDAVDADGKMQPQSVDYSKIVVHLVAACQEQQAQIEELKARVAALEAKS